ncbi:MAG: DUF881 domain-containing protein [Anaerolineae bacterium]|jgi:uncharacterized protein YlxW (UPF0749 family)
MNRKWAVRLSLTLLCLILGLLLVVQLRSQRDVYQAARSEGWDYAVVDLIDNNARLRDEIEALEAQLAELDQVQGGSSIVQSLVNRVNYLRIANGLVEVSGPGVVVAISGPVTVLDLHDLVNELRNAGAEALALNGQRIVAWSAISSDGVHATVDGQPVQRPYRLQVIGQPEALETALLRPGGLVSLLQQANQRIAIRVVRREKVTLPVYDQPLQFVYAAAVE